MTAHGTPLLKHFKAKFDVEPRVQAVFHATVAHARQIKKGNASQLLNGCKTTFHGTMNCVPFGNSWEKL